MKSDKDLLSQRKSTNKVIHDKLNAIHSVISKYMCFTVLFLKHLH